MNRADGVRGAPAGAVKGPARKPSAKPALLTAAASAGDLLQAGTVWKGLSSYIYPSSYPKDFVAELTIIRRDGNNFDGIWKADKGRVVCEVRGAVAGGSIELRATKSLRGEVDFADSPITGVISGDRIDFGLKHTTSTRRMTSRRPTRSCTDSSPGFSRTSASGRGRFKRR